MTIPRVPPLRLLRQVGSSRSRSRTYGSNGSNLSGSGRRRNPGCRPVQVSADRLPVPAKVAGDRADVHPRRRKLSRPRTPPLSASGGASSHRSQRQHRKRARRSRCCGPIRPSRCSTAGEFRWSRVNVGDRRQSVKNPEIRHCITARAAWLGRRGPTVSDDLSSQLGVSTGRALRSARWTVLLQRFRPRSPRPGSPVPGSRCVRRGRADRIDHDPRLAGDLLPMGARAKEILDGLKLQSVSPPSVRGGRSNRRGQRDCANRTT